MTGALSNIFICYAATEQEFVQDLVESFRRNGQIIWTDNSSSEDGAHERYSRVEAADHFLFVVSPESIASEDCLKALDHAVELKKHLVPIIRREVEITHPALAAAPQLSFRRSDNFRDAFKSLMHTVDTEINLAAFISYSRRDLVFTKKLETAFREKQRKVWIDEKDIQHTEEWLKAIYSGIEAADNFIFIISPDSIVSENCAKELAHAVKHNKRLIPVLYRAVNDTPVPNALAELDWIPFQDDDFDASFQTLLEAIDTDLDYVHAHTRLLTRALDWAKQGRDRGLLLRGRTLKEAERRRTQAIDTKPPFTPLQHEYISASRTDAHKRRWTIAAVSVVTLAIIAALIVISVRRNREAQSQAQIALSNRLANEAQKQLTVQSDLSLLLSLEAVKAADTFEARSALLAGLTRSSKIITYLRGQSNVPYTMAYSPDGKLLAVGTDAATVLVWDTATKQMIDPQLTGMESTVETLAFSPDSKTLATCGYGQDIRLWDVATRQQHAQLPLGEDEIVTSLLFSGDGKRLLVATEKGKIIIWNVESKNPLAQIQVLEEGFGGMGPVVFTDGESKVAAFTENGVLITWDSNTRNSPTKEHLATSAVWGMAFSPDGRLLAFGHSEAVSVYEVNSAKSLINFEIRRTNGIQKLNFSRDGKWLAISQGNGDLFLCNLTDGSRSYSPLFGHNREIYSLAFSHDGKTLASGGLDKNVILWDVEGQALRQTLVETKQFFNALAFTHDGKRLFAASTYWRSDQRSQIGIGEWDIFTRQQLNGSTNDTYNVIQSLRLLNESKILTAGLDENIIPAKSNGAANKSNDSSTVSTIQRNVVVWDGINSPRVLDQLKTTYSSSVASVTLSRDGALLAAGLNDGKVIIWDVVQWRQSGGPLLEHKIRVGTLDFSPDGKLLATGSLDRNAIIWELQTGRPIGRIVFPADQDVRSLAFSEDGKLLAVGTTRSIALWDVVKRQPLDTGITGQEGSAGCLAFSPDGSVLASGSFNTNIVLWDVAARKPIGVPLVGHRHAIQALSFSPDGQTLASASHDGRIILWDLRSDSLRSRACQIANRNLTREEWNRHLGTQQWRKTCPLI